MNSLKNKNSSGHGLCVIRSNHSTMVTVHKTQNNLFKEEVTSQHNAI